jgi:hypothetical protein
VVRPSPFEKGGLRGIYLLSPRGGVSESSNRGEELLPPLPLDIEDGKFILESACSDVFDFKAQIVSDTGTNLSKILSESIIRLKAIQRYRLTLGGESFNKFWEQGN